MKINFIIQLSYFKRIVSRLEFGNVHPLAVDIVLVNVTAINGNALISVIGAFISETEIL